MTPIAEMVRKLFEKGVGQEAILIAIEAAEQAIASMASRDNRDTSRDEILEQRRESDRLRQQRSRDKQQMSRESRDRHVMSHDASLYKQGSKKEERKEEAVRGSSRGQRLPENWEPSPQDRVTAEELVGARTAGELDKFRDHWKQQPGGRGVKLDWDAAWRNWIRRAAEFNGGKNGKTGSKIIQAADDLCRKIASFDGPQREPGIRDTESPFAPRLLSNR